MISERQIILRALRESVVFTILFTLIVYTVLHWIHINPYQITEFHNLSPLIVDFCEELRVDNLVLQPYNTWSNIGYFFVAFFIFSMGMSDKERGLIGNHWLKRFPSLSFLFAFGLGLVSFFSFFYHATGALLFQIMDLWSVVALSFVPLTFYTLKMFRRELIFKWLGKSFTFILLYYSVLSLFLSKLNLINRDIATIAILSTLSAIFIDVFTARKKGNLKLLGIAVLSLLLSGAAWIVDYKHWFCEPESVLQLHALWHVLTASSLFWLYMYLRSAD